MKTLKEWHESQLDLLDYLGTEPCEVDEDIYYDQLGAVSPAYLSHGLLQVGEPYTHDENNVPHYFTFKRMQYKHDPNGGDVLHTFYFIGILPEFKS